MPISSRCWHRFVQNPSFSETWIHLIIYRKKLNNFCAQILVGFPLLIRQRMLMSQSPDLMPNIRPLSPTSCLWECSLLFVLPVGILCQPASQVQSRLFPSCQVVFWLKLDSEPLIDHLGGVRSPLRPLWTLAHAQPGFSYPSTRYEFFILSCQMYIGF